MTPNHTPRHIASRPLTTGRNLGDLADFIGAFFSQPAGPGSDFNGDGLTEPDVLADYVNAFFAGCP